ncbi:MAG TPA: hypothetical protein VLX28_26305 [Thermoanaerobaculia bacterium]|nr:hypothetical protein [Thermoanaerobaculia bacterium]
MPLRAGCFEPESPILRKGIGQASVSSEVTGKRNIVIMVDYPALAALERRYQILKPVMDERLRRLWAAAEALALGEGGVSVLAGATGLSRTTIRSGIEELQTPESGLAQLTREGRARRHGAGRKATVERDGTLEADLETLLESSQSEDCRVLGWTCKSIRSLTEELTALGHQVSYRTIGNQLHRMGYRFSPAESYKKFSLAARREQFRRISHRTARVLSWREPVISLGIFVEANHQLVAPEPRAAGLAAAVLRYWWQNSGAQRFPQAQRMLLIMDTAGLASGDRAAWGPLLQPLAIDAGLKIDVSHFPPGARRWHRSMVEIGCSFSRPDQPGEALSIELDLVLSPEDELPHQTVAFNGQRDNGDDFWNYQIDRQPTALSQ